MEKKHRLTLYLLTSSLVSAGWGVNSYSRTPYSTPSQPVATLVSQTTIAQATPAPTTPPPAPATPPETVIPKPAISGLIPSTNPDSRRAKINSDRQDPFLQVNIPVKLTPIVEPGGAAKPTSTKPPKPTNDVASIPQPDLARQVVINGVVEIDGQPQIILKAPNEPYSRYVKTGQYLSNGKVLVKKVKMSAEGAPIVILQEAGMEVVKTVGDITR